MIIPTKKSPIPIDPKKLLKILKFGWDFIKNVLDNTGLEKTKSVNVDDCDVSDISEINSIFNKFVSSIESEVDYIEEKIKEELYYYLDEVIDFLEEKKKIFRTDSIVLRSSKQINRLKEKIDGKLKREVSKRISLDNPECKRIIRMQPGNKKSEKLKLFFERTISESINELVKFIRENIEELFDDIEFSIDMKLDEIESNLLNQIEKIKNIEESNNENIDTNIKIITEAVFLLELSNYVLEEFEMEMM